MYASIDFNCSSFHRTFVNVYIGWATKYLGASFIPVRGTEPIEEFDDEAVPLKEATDPTVMQEEEARLREEAKRLSAEAMEEGEGEEEDED